MNNSNFFDFMLDEELGVPVPNQLFQNVRSGPFPGQFPLPRPFTNSVTTANNVLPRDRRSHMPIQNSGGPMCRKYNAYNPYNRYYMDEGPFNSYRQPMINQYQNPIIHAAAQNIRPAFESIHSIVQSFIEICKMIDSTSTAIHTYFHALLSIADNCSRLRTFLMKLHSTVVSLKLVRWFLTKLIYLIRLVKGDRDTKFEDVLSSLLSTAQGEVIPSVGSSWPFVVFTGILVTAPYFVYKFLNTVVQTANSGLPMNNPNTSASGSKLVYESQSDWNSKKLRTIPLVKGQKYWTCNSQLQKSLNSGWIHVKNANCQKGYVPLRMLQLFRKDHTLSPSQLTLLKENPNPINEVKVSTGPQHEESKNTTTPITNVNGK